MNATRQQVRKRCAELGASLVKDDGRIGVEAPHGFKWSSMDLHECVVNFNLGETAWAWGCLLDDMADGIEPCHETDCEWCLTSQETEIL